MSYAINKISDWRGQANLAFIKRLYLIRQQDLINMVDPIQELGTMTIPMEGIEFAEIPSGHLIDFDFPPKTAGMSAEGDGEKWTISIMAEIPKNTVPDADSLKNYQGMYVAVMVDFNNQVRIAGDQEQGMKMTLTQSITSKNSLTISLSGVTDHPIWFLENEILEALITNE